MCQVLSWGSKGQYDSVLPLKELTDSMGTEAPVRGAFTARWRGPGSLSNRCAEKAGPVHHRKQEQKSVL